MRYIVLMRGAGGECDLAFACNKDFLVFDAADDRAALEKCRGLWKSHGGTKGNYRVDAMELHVIDRTVCVPIRRWKEEP